MTYKIDSINDAISAIDEKLSYIKTSVGDIKHALRNDDMGLLKNQFPPVPFLIEDFIVSYEELIAQLKLCIRGIE